MSAEFDRAWESTRFADLAAVLPCCGRTSSLNDLNFHGPAGFARFALVAFNPGRAPLTRDELAEVAAELGAAVRQVMAHY